MIVNDQSETTKLLFLTKAQFSLHKWSKSGFIYISVQLLLHTDLHNYVLEIWCANFCTAEKINKISSTFLPDFSHNFALNQ